MPFIHYYKIIIFSANRASTVIFTFRMFFLKKGLFQEFYQIENYNFLQTFIYLFNNLKLEFLNG